MHEYYEKNREKLKKIMKGFLSLVGPELERVSGKPFAPHGWTSGTFMKGICLRIFPI